jgi:hypothetical protein
MIALVVIALVVIDRFRSEKRLPRSRDRLSDNAALFFSEITLNCQKMHKLRIHDGHRNVVFGDQPD